MARPKRTYRTPVVITLAAVAPACVPGLNHDGSEDGPGTGGAVDDDGGPDGAGGSISSGGFVAAGGLIGAGGSWSGGASSGGLGGVPDYPECPSGDTLYGFTVPCVPEERCQIEMSCTSGNNRYFVFACAASGDYWSVQSEACAYPAEYCRSMGSGDAICGDDGWMYQGEGGNPPAPCPEARPTEDSACSAGYGFGADRQACGYPCSPDGPWTVTGCFAADPEDPYSDSSWQSDGACSNEGEGGEGP